MSLALAATLTAGTVVFAAFILVALFRHLTPHVVAIDYKSCVGGWWEAELNGCQAGLLRIPQQPINTHTNLAYLAAGMFTTFALDTPSSFAFATTMVYLCVGSALYHATSTHWGGMLDVTGIYAVYSGLLVRAATSLAGASEAVASAAMLVIAGIASYFLSQRFRRAMHWKIGAFLGGTYLLLVARMWQLGDWTAWPLLVGSLAAFAIAFGIWHLDRARRFLFPRWGHGLWHVLTAAASATLFLAAHRTA